jgi:hypothetical protein
MALNRDQVGLTFQIDVDAMDAQQQLALFRGVVEGVAAETREQFGRMGSQIGTTFSGASRSLASFRDNLGASARGELVAFTSQFGLVGDAASGMIPALSGAGLAFAGLAAGAGVAVAGLASAASAAMTYTGQIDDLAQVSGLTTETIQSLRLAATLSGQSFEDAGTAAVIFQKQIEAAKGGNEELASTFKQLGVDINGPVDQAFRTALERLGQVEDGSGKTAIALDLFGKSGAKLLPVMDQVGGSFDGLIGRARELGLVLDQEAIDKSNKLADSIDILKLRFSAFIVDVGIGAIDAFDRIAASISGVSTSIRQLFTDASTIIPNLQKLLTASLLSTLPGGVGVDISKVFGGAATKTPGFSGPGIDELTGLPTLKITKPTKGAKGGADEKAAAEKAINLPTDDGVKRAYDAYIQAVIREEARAQAALDAARLAAIDDEQARLEEILRRQSEQLEAARVDAAANAFNLATSKMYALRVAALDQERAITLAKIDELNAAKDAKLEAQYAKEIEDYRTAQNRKLDEMADALNREQELIDAANARKRAAQEADVSSPLNIFGAAGQEAADRGAGIFGQLGASASSALSEVSNQMGNFGTMMTDVFNGVAGGLQNMLQNFIMTGRVGGQAFKAMAAQIISAVTAQAAVKAIFELAEGFAASARYDFASASQHFAAAKFYGVVAGVAAAAAVGISAIGPGGGGGGGHFLTENRGGGGSVMREQGSRRNEPQVIIIRAETEPGVMVSKVIQDYKSNGEMRGVLRRDLLGEY